MQTNAISGAPEHCLLVTCILTHTCVCRYNCKHTHTHTQTFLHSLSQVAARGFPQLWHHQGWPRRQRGAQILSQVFRPFCGPKKGSQKWLTFKILFARLCNWRARPNVIWRHFSSRSCLLRFQRTLMCRRLFLRFVMPVWGDQVTCKLQHLDPPVAYSGILCKLPSVFVRSTAPKPTQKLEQFRDLNSLRLRHRQLQIHALFQAVDKLFKT